MPKSNLFIKMKEKLAYIFVVCLQLLCFCENVCRGNFLAFRSTLASGLNECKSKGGHLAHVNTSNIQVYLIFLVLISVLVKMVAWKTNF